MSFGPGEAGRMVAGRYRLLERLGAGAYGTVWRAFDAVLDVTVAVKELHVFPSASDEDKASLLARVEREAKTVAKLRDHPHVVTILDVVQEHGQPWIVMELVLSRSFAEIVHEHGPVPPTEVARVGAAILDALIAAHQVGITHRDVKPANILIAEDGRVVLVDFGVAVHESDPTITAGPIGTLAYMAPEQFEGMRALPASDLFSLGATLYFAAEGRSPFARATEAATIHAVITEEPSPPQRAGRLTGTILALLAKDPANRMAAAAAHQALVDAAAPPRGDRLVAAATQIAGDRQLDEQTAQLPDPPPAGPGRAEQRGRSAGPPPAQHSQVGASPPACYKESLLGRIVGLLLILGPAGITAAPWIAARFVDFSPWAYVVAAPWSIFFASWTAIFSYFFFRPDRLLLDASGILYRVSTDEYALRWDEIRSVCLSEGRLEIELEDEATGERYRDRSVAPMYDATKTLVFCRLADLRCSATRVEADLRTFAGSKVKSG